MADKKNIAVLGAGPAGIAAAYALARLQKGRITVLERSPVLGGNSASFLIDGIICDFGSHRFHPAAEPEVLADVQDLLGDDLLLRPRHGRIRLGGKWIHFPLKPLDALLRLPKSFAISLLWDMVAKPFRRKTEENRTFSTILHDGLGPTISKHFYFPYVRKLWGLEPEKLAVKLAERRISSGSVAKILMKMLKMVPGLKSGTTGKFFYPRKGFGQIGSAMAEAAEEMGADFHLGTEIKRINRDGAKVTGYTVLEGDKEVTYNTDQVMATIPLTGLVSLVQPPAPQEVQAAVEAMSFRGMILIYLKLATDQFTEFDAHYFPETSIPISRMSEPKNYSAATNPKGRTILCAELPCDPHEKWWGMSDEELGAEFCKWLGQLGLPVEVEVLGTETRRLAHAYPVYTLDYEQHFNVIDDWLSSLEGMTVFGRQGLFAHDNTHHALAMAYGAVDSLDEDAMLDRDKWRDYREVFATHTVED